MFEDDLDLIASPEKCPWGLMFGAKHDVNIEPKLRPNFEIVFKVQTLGAEPRRLIKTMCPLKPTSFKRQQQLVELQSLRGFGSFHAFF